MYTFCLVGCLCQVDYITIQYFLYETITQLAVVNEEFLSVPVASICFPLYSFETTSEVFDTTPSLEKFGKLSKIAKDDFPYNYHAENAKQSLKFINVKRSVKKYFLCYSLKI